MERVQLEPRAEALLTPVRPQLQAAIRELPGASRLQVSVGEVPGFAALEGDRLVLSSRLEGPELAHPCEEPDAPLDRWRRALAAVLEGLAARALAHDAGREAAWDWLTAGAAIDAADRALPELRLAVPDLAVAWRTGDLAAHPRGGVAATRAWRAMSVDPWARAIALLRGEPLPAGEWLRVADRALAEMSTWLPIPVARVADADVPVDLGPWRWQPIAIPAHARGGRIVVHGSGAVGGAWAVADRVHRTLAVSLAGGCRLGTDPGAPVGDWEVTSAAGFGQVFGVRGVSFGFRSSGGVDVVLADAFVGPVQALAIAERVGTSGVATGTWKIAGDHRLRFAGLTPQGLTMHGRQERFAIPAGPMGLGTWLEAMEAGEWAWSLDSERLALRGEMMGDRVEVRLKRAT